MASSVVALVMALLLVPVTAEAQALEQNDAGSGRDAGHTFATAVAIQPGVFYDGVLRPDTNIDQGATQAAGDDDWFTFSARAGQEIFATLDGSTWGGCMWLDTADGTEVANSGCTDSLSGVAPDDGTYVLVIGNPVADAQPYNFAVGLDAPPSTDADMGTPTGPGQVVVAVADSGVNPYHEIYHRPENTAHPCTWVEGFDDCSIPALNLSIGEYDSLEEAYAADRDVWESLDLHQWYWIPETNIIGAVCEGSASLTDGSNGACIMDENGHGTGATSSVLSEAPDALLLVHEGNAGAYDLATAPVAPDIQSHSWGAAVPVPLHAANPVIRAVGADTTHDREVFHEETIRFVAAGNEGAFPTFLDYSKVHPDTQVVGGGYPGWWTPMSWTVYDFASWYCRPTALHDAVRGYRPSHCGTSFATPTVAGTAAAALAEIRDRDGTTGRSTPEMVSRSVSRDTFIKALRSAATYDPQPGRFPNQPEPHDQRVVEGAEYLSWGYGWLDRTRVDAIVACALDDICPSKTGAAEQYNAGRQEVRRASAEPGS